MKLPPISLYIHYPWCEKKCPYCDFNSHEKGDKSNYIPALLQDLERDLPHLQNRKIHTVFIGGGTPSLLSVAELETLFFGLRSKLNFKNDIEITLETNPGSFEVEKFEQFRKIGINRLSIGVQSFHNQQLQSLGRIHNADEAIHACEQARKVGFDNFNIDLMYGLANQNISQCLADIHQAIAFNPSHISFYQLTIEPNTYFAKFPPILPKDDDIWHMGKAGAKLLTQNGLEHYEVSAFAKIPSNHNLNYWQFGDYLGIGAGAHGKITLANGKIIRTLKPKSPKDYLHNSRPNIKNVDNPGFEFMLNALRLKAGFSPQLFEQTTQKNISSIHKQLQQSELLGLLELGTIIKPTSKGYDFLNDLQQLFL